MELWNLQKGISKPQTKITAMMDSCLIIFTSHGAPTTRFMQERAWT